MSEVVLREMDDGIAVLTINRPEAYNALNADVIAGLGEQIDAAVAGGARAIVITGAGDKAFVAGADIKAMTSQPKAEASDFARRGQAVFAKLTAFGGVTIAAVNGFALGGGCELAMACDLTVAAENARFGQPEVNLGIIPGYGGTQRMVRRVGLQRALELCLTARQVEADEAARIGLVLEVVPVGQAVRRAKELARVIMSKGPLAIRLTKEAVHAAAELELVRGLDLEAARFGLAFQTEDADEGIAAFVEKRQAAFQGK